MLLQHDVVAKRYGHDVLHVEMPPHAPAFEADAFVFKDGTAVFWNARDEDIAVFRSDVTGPLFLLFKPRIQRCSRISANV